MHRVRLVPVMMIAPEQRYLDTYFGIPCDACNSSEKYKKCFINSFQPEFPDFSRLIEATIAELGGSAFIKTNWHSPKDAFWITAGQTMCCKDITDVYQLLKASGICKDDLMCHKLPIFETCDVNDLEPNENGDQSNFGTNINNQYLVFKKWHDIHPGTEFRCFVRNKRIVGISPRDWPQYHEYICTQKVNIINDIVTMFKEHVKPKFPLFDCK